MNEIAINHLYWRAGFGLSPKKMAIIRDIPKPEIIATLFKEAKETHPIYMDLSEFTPLINNKALYKTDQKLFRLLRKKGRQMVHELNYKWIDRIKTSSGVFREKMILFWSNIFVCRDIAIHHALPYHNLLREHSLGNFGEFIKAVSRSASMGKYLNTRQNKKTNPNENFARELMELFTLGIGNYTEKDIREAARAFTGWSFDGAGNFEILEKHHDNGSKTFLGKTGNFSGDDIIDIILEQEQCAKYICTKVYKYFVNPEVDETRVQELVSLFYKNYDIAELMRYIFESDWFYEEQNIGAKIKSPIELIVGIHKVVPFTFDKKEHLLFVQRMMGQILLDPPNVSGWKANRNWIDATTLMFRLNLPSAILQQEAIEFSEKGEFTDSFNDYYKENTVKRKQLKAQVDWNTFRDRFSISKANNSIKNTEIQHTIKQHLLTSQIDPDTEQWLEQLKDTTFETYCIQLMSLPEYQLC